MYKKIYTILIGLIILLTTPITGITCTSKLDEELIINKAIETVDGQILELNVNGWGKVGSSFLNKEAIESICNKVVEDLELEKLVYKYEESQQHRVLKTSGFKAGKIYMEIIVQSVNPNWEAEPKPETYIVVTAIQHKSAEGFMKLKNEISRIIQGLGGEPEVTSCITVVREGKLSVKEQDSLITKIFSAVEAKPVEGIIDSHVISRSGYTPHIRDCINVMGKKINTNVASRYNSYEDRTYFWIGTPLISIEY